MHIRMLGYVAQFCRWRAQHAKKRRNFIKYVFADDAQAWEAVQGG